MGAELHLRSESPEATERLGEELGRRLAPGALVVLDGELGAGKTCFVRGLARGLGVTERVTSPTYALLQTYPGRIELAHLDAWMEGRERAFLLDGGLDWITGAGTAAVTVIEWGSRVLDVLPAERLRVLLEHAGPSTRRILLRVEGAGPSSERLARAFADLPSIEELAVEVGCDANDRGSPAQ